MQEHINYVIIIYTMLLSENKLHAPTLTLNSQYQVKRLRYVLGACRRNRLDNLPKQLPETKGEQQAGKLVENNKVHEID